MWQHRPRFSSKSPQTAFPHCLNQVVPAEDLLFSLLFLNCFFVNAASDYADKPLSLGTHPPRGTWLRMLDEIRTIFFVKLSRRHSNQTPHDRSAWSVYHNTIRPNFDFY